MDNAHNVKLGGGFGPGFKVAGGYDFVGDGCKSALGVIGVPLRTNANYGRLAV